jgi:hypothetical protein
MGEGGEIVCDIETLCGYWEFYFIDDRGRFRGWEFCFIDDRGRFRAWEFYFIDDKGRFLGLIIG